MMIKFFQHNLNKQIAAVDILVKQQLSILKEAFICLVQEPNSRGGKLTGWPAKGMQKFLPSGDRPRVAITASSDLDLWYDSKFSDEDVCTCLWKSKGPQKDVYIVSAYLDVNFKGEQIFPEKLRNLLKFTQEDDTPLIIGVDCNAWSTLWGSDTNQRGLEIEELIFRHNLTLQNVGKMPTFEVLRGDIQIQTCIDITLTRGDLDIEGWRVRSVQTGSDHKVISFDLRTQIARKTEIFQDTKNADWELFNRLIEGRDFYVPHTIDCEWLDFITHDFQTGIQKALTKACPVKRVKHNLRRPEYWSTELEIARKEMRAAWSLYTKHKTTALHEKYVMQRRTFSNTLKRCKRGSWRAFVESSSNAKEISKVNKVMQGTVNHAVGLLSDVDGACTPDGSVDLLLDTHFPGSVTHKIYGKPPRRSYPSYKLNSEEFDYVSIEKIKWAIQMFGKQKAAGPDGLKPLVLQQLNRSNLTRLGIIFRASMALEYVPRVWRESKVIFIPKPGKERYDRAKSF